MPVAAVGLLAAGGIASSFINAGAAKDAAAAQIGAIKHAPKLDIPATEQAATDADLKRFQAGLDTQNRLDPDSAAMRTQGAKTVLDQLNNGSAASDAALKSLQSQSDTDNAANSPIIAQLIAQAKAELEAGATLPPEFQAELVRSGLEGSSSAGNALSGSGSTGAHLRTLLGGAGIQLKAQRQGQALSLLGGAQNLEQQRANILSGIATLGSGLTESKFQQGLRANITGGANVPSVGLTGSDVASLNVSKVNTAAQNAANIGQLQGQQKLANGQLLSSIIGSGTNLLAAGASKYFTPTAAPTNAGSALSYSRSSAAPISWSTPMPSI